MHVLVFWWLYIFYWFFFRSFVASPPLEAVVLPDTGDGLYMYILCEYLHEWLARQNYAVAGYFGLERAWRRYRSHVSDTRTREGGRGGGGRLQMVATVTKRAEHCRVRVLQRILTHLENALLGGW